uniref:NADH dehydrogenase [ubiquinone] 1 alpha subcomplex subunit 12 n=1 Tax=Cyclopterus lumpus TaxID=8103 RepID=A0A8C3ACX2_CYCLU
MAEYANLVRRAFEQIRGHGGLRGFVVQMLRVQDAKVGALVGVDKYGNKYYEDKKYFFGRHRWVIYTKEMNGKNTMWDLDASMVPSEWHGWLHCMTENPPTTHPPVPKKFLAEVHQFNVSATSERFRDPERFNEETHRFVTSSPR